ncbi:MFS transporter [Sphingobium sp. AN641]|uniref:MFS transporter n=1 Tax=Sphingobium sp. AN641 TaxID=3133443 RepID=UPI0030BFB2A8
MMVSDADTATNEAFAQEQGRQRSSAPPQESRQVTAAWYALAVLCIVTLLSQLDRHVTTIIVAPLKQEFSMSDTQFGLLHGYGFALTYAIFGIPFGRLVDRKSRRNIILYGLLAWSLFTSLSAFADSYAQLVILRTGVGIGEAVLGPAAYSLLIDFFEPHKRGRATGIYYMAMSVGGGASLFLGGALLQRIPPIGLDLGGLITLEPWRLLFLFAGLPGIFACLLMLTIQEPVRRGMVSGETASIRDFLDYAWKNIALLGRISAAGTLAALAGYGSGAWAPTLLERRFGLPPASTAWGIGTAIIVGSILGTVCGGWLSDRMIKRGKLSARTHPMFFGYITYIPAATFGLMPNPWLAVLGFGLLLFSVAMVQSATPLALQEAVPAHMRGQIVALQYLILALCSIGLGPTLVGLITDLVFKSGDMLGWSLLTLALPIALIGFMLCGWGLNERAYRILKDRQAG